MLSLRAGLVTRWSKRSVLFSLLGSEFSARSLSGFRLETVRVSKQPGSGLIAGPQASAFPEWVWLRVLGRAYTEDFGISDHGLVVSRRVVEILVRHGISDGVIYSPSSAPTSEQRLQNVLAEMEAFRREAEKL